MHKYTSVWISRWMVLGPRLWLLLALAVSLVAALNVPTEPGQSAIWVWPEERGWLWLRPSRVGRWVWRLSRIVRASSVCLACRVGLMASLVAASGLTATAPVAWHWVWLPVVDWGLGVVGWMHPAGLTCPGYQALRRSTHQAYQWSVAWLGVLAVRRWVTVGPAGMLLGAVVQCEWDDSRVELDSVPGPDGQTTYRARLSGKFVIEVTPRDEYEKRLMILELRHASRRTPGREASSWGLVRQEALAPVFGVTQEEISRWLRYVREGLWAQLLSLQEKSLLTDDLRQQIVDVWANSIWQTAAQVLASLFQDHLRA